MPLLHPAPLWAPDLSDYLILWHGCTAFDKIAIEAKGIDVAKCAVNTDFGQGFYTTTLERQARQWAWDRFYFRQARYPKETGNRPVVLRFRVPRYTLSSAPHEQGMDKLLALHFVRDDFDAEDFWSLVQHCRQSTPADPAKKVEAIVHHHVRPKTDWYDLVSGSVAAFWKQRIAMNGADQFSFHKRGINLLNALVKKGKQANRGGQGNEKYYRWYPVVP